MSFRYENGPEINMESIVREIKQAINDDKFSQIDYDRKALEVWPDSGDEAYPEMRSYAAQWEEFCNYVEEVTDNDGKGFPEKIQKLFKAKDKEITEAVNNDKDFWEKLRAEVLPYYDRCKEKDYWENDRWKSIDFWYDPIGLEVKTDRVERVMNADMTLGEIRSRTPVSQRTIPPGFTIRIN